MVVKGANNACAYSSSPKAVAIAIDYVKGKKVNVVEEIKKALALSSTAIGDKAAENVEIGASKASDKCPINELNSFKTASGLATTRRYLLEADSKKPRSTESSIFTVSDPVKMPYFVKVGGDVSFRQSNLVQATVTVCGKETIAAVAK